MSSSIICIGLVRAILCRTAVTTRVRRVLLIWHDNTVEIRDLSPHHVSEVLKFSKRTERLHAPRRRVLERVLLGSRE